MHVFLQPENTNGKDGNNNEIHFLKQSDSSMKRLMNILMCCSIFMDDFYFFREPFDFYYFYIIYFVFILYYIIKTGSLAILPGWFFKYLLVLFGLSLLAGLFYGTLGFSFAKQVIGITFSSTAFYCLLKINKFDVIKIFNTYLSLAFLVALWGIIVEVVLLAGYPISDKIKTTTIGLFRAYSVMSEPYFLAVVLIPALYYLGYRFMTVPKSRFKFDSIVKLPVIFICFILTFSSAGYIALMLMAIMFLYNKNYFSISKGGIRFILLPLFMILALFLVGNLKDYLFEFQARIDDTVGLFTKGSGASISAVSEANSSTFALYSNYVIAQNSFNRNPIFGSGLGSHASNYDKMFSMYFPKDFLIRFGSFNKFDANSLFLRLMSETGLFGLISIFYFLFKFFMRKKGLRNKEFFNLNIINQGIFILIVVRLVRTGNYIGNGFFMFFFIYYYSKKIFEQKKALNYRLKKLEVHNVPPAPDVESIG